MLKTTPISSFDAAEKVDDISRKLHLATLALDGLDDQENAAPIAEFIWQVRSELEELAEAIHPTSPHMKRALAKLDAIRAGAERRERKVIAEGALA